MRVTHALLAGLLVSSCATSNNVVEACTQELGMQFIPRDTTLVVGESFKARVQLLSCGGRRRLSDDVVWKVEDERVATVDSVSGRVTAVAPGETVVSGKGRRYGELRGIRLLVRSVPL